MNTFVRAAMASAFVLTTTVPNMASASPPPPPVHFTTGTSSAAGVAATGGFLGFVGLLVSYDLIRRTTCSGDFLHLGGPGFTQPITPMMSVLSPRCAPVYKAPVVRIRG